jgi:hypothetical protein
MQDCMAHEAHLRDLGVAVQRKNRLFRAGSPDRLPADPQNAGEMDNGDQEA